jgi:hypothetical protein
MSVLARFKALSKVALYTGLVGLSIGPVRSQSFPTIERLLNGASFKKNVVGAGGFLTIQGYGLLLLVLVRIVLLCRGP